MMAFIDYFVERDDQSDEDDNVTVSHDFGGATSASGLGLRLFSVHRDIGKDEGRGLATQAARGQGSGDPP